MTTHTPGPWVVSDDGLVAGLDSRARFAGTPSLDIFDASEWPTDLAVEAMATARLIAAAPELLEMAKLLERSIVYEMKKSERDGDGEGARLMGFRLAEVRAVLAKAEGRTP